LADSANSEISGDLDVMRMEFSTVDKIKSDAMKKFLTNHLQTMLAGIQ